ncbi:sulfite exporter TauE/SafE family protein [Synechococcus sp. J7-Johnson]|uniref:sulfite exporter TauE/SafE family protein n=1 Tax=Synechococcus sp. J7-Johnson TaxID=2823737 RepID=UPI0020CCE147|nr:sulfite exporter TauE/SafE family protein [Synechococcus sp. J7-Johnson]MCP9841104.1 sulfite exporter TauE/SafE family protein [Synechococcus sp. J7-Johnson]
MLITSCCCASPSVGWRFLYSSVGHAGASGYIAVLSLVELSPSAIKPTALMLNILVATIATWQFARRGHFSWSLFWPFAVLAVPMAFVGGYLNLPVTAFRLIVGVVLVLSAVRFIVGQSADTACSPPAIACAIPIGAGLGLLSGLTGTGGGIFLTPLLLMMRWSTVKSAAAVSALFILLNSVAGLLGNVSSTKNFPTFAIPLAIVAVAAGFAGAHFGSHRFPHTTIKRILAQG